MQKFNKVVQIELNELSADVINSMMKAGHMPFFKENSHRWSFHCTTSEQEYQLLEPWIQWVTAHTGKTFSEHKIFHLGDGPKLEFPQVWEVLEEQNMASCIMGSMNTVRRNFSSGVFFPDPWSKENTAFPNDLQPLWSLISNKVQSHTQNTLGLSDMINGLSVALKYGVKYSTIVALAKQIVNQKVNPKTKWKLAALFDKFQAEMFLFLQKKHEFQFSTLFLNSVAHYQHHYWRNFDNHPFQTDLSYDDINETDDPMVFGYQMYDKILEKVFKQVSDDTLVIICTGLSQEPFIDKDKEGGMHYYRIKDHSKFIHELGLDGLSVFPLMSRDWQIEVPNNMDIQKVKTTLESLQVDEKRLFQVQQNSERTFFIETNFTSLTDQKSVIKGCNNIMIPFYSIFQHIALKSGAHNQEGYAWLSNKEYGLKFNNKFPLTDLFHINLAALQNV